MYIKEMKKTLKEIIHDNEYKEILKGTYLNNVIITEKLLMEKYNVSKAPVRDALIQLCSEDMLISIPRCGYKIKDISNFELQDTLQLRIVVELGAFELYKNKLKKEEFDILKEHVKTDQQLAKDKEVYEHWFHNMDFHLVLAKFCKNDLMVKVIKETLNKCSRYAYQYFQNSWTDHKLTDASNHKEFIKLMENGEFKKAKECLSNDIMEFNNIFYRN